MQDTELGSGVVGAQQLQLVSALHNHLRQVLAHTMWGRGTGNKKLARVCAGF